MGLLLATADGVRPQVVPVFVLAFGIADDAEVEEALFLNRHHASVVVPHTPRRAAMRTLYDTNTPGAADESFAARWRSGMVLGVQTNAAAVVVDAECNGNARSVDPRDPRRAVLASLLQLVWNVAPTHEVGVVLVLCWCWLWLYSVPGMYC